MCHLLPISHSLFSSPTPGRAALGLHSPSPRVCTRGWAYADVITKISRIDRLPNFLTHGAPLARFARRSSAITTVCFMFFIKLRWPKTKSLYNRQRVYIRRSAHPTFKMGNPTLRITRPLPDPTWRFLI